MEIKSNKIKFGDRVITAIGLQKIVLHDCNSAQSVWINKELYAVVKSICENKWNIKDVIESCETKEDRDYLVKNLLILMDKKIIRDFDDVTEYEDLNIRIDWNITNRCNLKCKHCCIDANQYAVDLTLAECYLIIERIASLNPCSWCISGGEPLVRPDFKEIIDKIRELYHGHLSILTNATLISDDMARYIKTNFNSISVSVDGVDEETCSFIRGKGVFEKTIEGISKLQKIGMHNISASMVVTKSNIRFREKFKNMCDEMGIKPIYRQLALVGRAAEELTGYVPDGDEVLTYKEKEGGSEINELVEYPARIFSCGAGYRQFQVDYKGNIYPCQALTDDIFKLGNVLEESEFDRYIRERRFIATDGYKNLEMYFPYNYIKCQKCTYQIFCWSCIEPIYHAQDKRIDCLECYRKFEKCLS
ncbi:MAG: radical SAM protein [Lachnospiraceae bacterium]|nr:radical SAM protein [Lachnospiraceae bacterium]